MDISKVKGEPLTILLVEDNPGHAELVLRTFQHHRIANKIYHVSDGEEALNYLYRKNSFSDPKKSPCPHLILLDLRLPKIDGMEVLKEIKKTDELKKIPIVILTTSAAEPDTEKAYKHYANSYLVKPIDFNKFTQLMNDLGFYWLGWNHHPW
ncbi:MAG: response regulator [Candidatus Kuenenia sp.]|nr:response regulator [Candidatus Kuenenia hertensis]